MLIGLHSFNFDTWVAEVCCYSVPETLVCVWILRAILLFKVEQTAFLPFVFLKWCNWLLFCFTNLTFSTTDLPNGSFIPWHAPKSRKILTVAQIYLFWLTFLMKPMEEQNLTLFEPWECYLCMHHWLVDNFL